MAIRRILSQAADYDAELENIDYQIYLFQTMGEILLSNDFKVVGMIMETLPLNGAQPNQYPLYPPPQSPFFMMLDPEDESKKSPPQPIGFTRVYNPTELDDSNMLTISLDIKTNLALAIIQRAIQKLRERKKQILAESKKIVKDQ